MLAQRSISPRNWQGDGLDDVPCGILSTLPDGMILSANRAVLEWTGLDRDTLIGHRRFQDLLTVPGRIYYQTHLEPLLLMQGSVKEIALHLMRDGRAPMPVLVTSVASSDAGGRPSLIRTTVFDASDRTKYEGELRRARIEAEQLATIVQSSAEAIISVDKDNRILSWNPGAETIFGWTMDEAIGREISALIPNDALSAQPDSDWSVTTTAVDRAKLHRSGRTIELSISVTAMRDSDGNRTSRAIVCRDVSARKRAERNVALLVGEIKHRSKNLLGVVQAIIRLTAKSTPPERLAGEISSRIQALAASQDLLTADPLKGVDLADLIGSQLRHIAEGSNSRIAMNGPNLRVRAEAAQAIGLAVHELCTNAAKHGALSNDSGRVTIEWNLEGDPDNKTFSIVWTESGGPSVSTPIRSGFGTTVLSSLTRAGLGAEVDLAYHSSGVVWRASCAFDRLSVSTVHTRARQLQHRSVKPSGNFPGQEH
jgi:PAS domain S-box-containing protein